MLLAYLVKMFTTFKEKGSEGENGGNERPRNFENTVVRGQA